MLKDFRSQKITWDKANRKIYDTMEASQGDSNGRILQVQVVDGVWGWEVGNDS